MTTFLLVCLDLLHLMWLSVYLGLNLPPCFFSPISPVCSLFHYPLFLPSSWLTFLMLSFYLLYLLISYNSYVFCHFWDCSILLCRTRFLSSTIFFLFEGFHLTYLVVHFYWWWIFSDFLCQKKSLFVSFIFEFFFFLIIDFWVDSFFPLGL